MHALEGRQGANGQGEEVCLLPTSLGADSSLPPTPGTGSNSASEHLPSGPAALCWLSWDHRYAISFSPAPRGLTGAQGLRSLGPIGWPGLQASPTGPSPSSHPSQGHQQRPPKKIPFSASPQGSGPNHRTRGSKSCSHLALPCFTWSGTNCSPVSTLGKNKFLHHLRSCHCLSLRQRSPGAAQVANTGLHGCTSECANLDKEKKKGHSLSWGTRVGEWVGAVVDPERGTGRRAIRSVLSKENFKTAIKPTKSVHFMLSLRTGHCERQG